MATNKKTPKFERQADSRRGVKDLEGRVTVRIILVGTNGRRIHGNMSRSFTLRSAKVGEVTEAIELALFGDDD